MLVNIFGSYGLYGRVQHFDWPPMQPLSLVQDRKSHPSSAVLETCSLLPNWHVHTSMLSEVIYMAPPQLPRMISFDNTDKVTHPKKQEWRGMMNSSVDPRMGTWARVGDPQKVPTRRKRRPSNWRINSFISLKIYRGFVCAMRSSGKGPRRNWAATCNSSDVSE